jgi:hypothetical protein
MPFCPPGRVHPAAATLLFMHQGLNTHEAPAALCRGAARGHQQVNSA